MNASTFRERARCQKGSTLIMVAAAAAMVFGFAALAIDGAMMMTTRTQLHNAADAAALAGATALINGDRNEATLRAIAFAKENTAFQDTNSPVNITAGDVTINDAGDIIRVETHRTKARGDALRTFFMNVIGGGTSADMTAAAAARVYDICSSRCIKPWAIPDRWNDTNGNGAWDPGEYYSPEGTGYAAPRDVGTEVTLKIGDPHHTVAPGVFYIVDFPPLGSGEGKPLTGKDVYREWITECSPYVVKVGDRLQTELGNAVGPTKQGVNELIEQDPGAYWDESTQSVQGSAFAQSPRIGLIPFFDPTQHPGSGRDYVTVTKLGAFFIERPDKSSEVRGRFVQITSQGAPCAGGSGSSFVKAIVLVE